ncbi:hypothetical protein ACHAQH_008302 [Verticillium albo-atrum]
MPGLLFSDGMEYYHHHQVRTNSPRSSRPTPAQREAIRNRVNPLAPRETLYPGVFPAAPVYPPRVISPDEILPWDSLVIPASAFERGEVVLRKQQAAAAKAAKLRAAKLAAKRVEKAEKKAEKKKKAEEKVEKKIRHEVEEYEQEVRDVHLVTEQETHLTTQSPVKEKMIYKLRSMFFTKDKKSLVENCPIKKNTTGEASAEMTPLEHRAVHNSTDPYSLLETEHSPSISSIDSSPGLPTNLLSDQGDESLQRYKESLGLGGGGKDLSDPSDPRVCIIDSLSMEAPGRDAATVDLSTPGSELTLKDKPFKVKEGAKFTMVAKFRVQHEILSGLQYVQIVKRKGIRVSKDSEMLGSFAPNTDKTPTYTKRFQEEDAPSGMLARGHYNATSSFVDDDKKTHLAFEWSFDIAKDW